MKIKGIILTAVLLMSIFAMGACNRSSDQRGGADSTPQRQGGTGAAPSRGGGE